MIGVISDVRTYSYLQQHAYQSGFYQLRSLHKDLGLVL